MKRTILKGGLLLDPASDREEMVDVAIEGGTIAEIATQGQSIQAKDDDEVITLNGEWVVPGLVDLSCALREPGYEQNETIATGLAAAAKGGITSVCASPETSPITDNASVVIQVLEKARLAKAARLIPIGAATQGLRGDALASYGELKEHGCPGVTQGTETITSANMMRRALEYALAFDVVVINQALESSMKGLCDEGPWSTRLGLPATPAQAEYIAIERDLALAELTGGRLHLTRVSTAIGVEAIARAKARGVNVSCDVTAHHLHLTSAALVDYDSNYKVWPPLRNDNDVQALRKGLADGTIDAITSDHRPVHVQDKALEFMDAEFGISGLETLLPLTLKLVEEGVFSRLAAIRALSNGPRRILHGETSPLAPGDTADLTIIDPHASWILDEGSMVSKGTNTPFLGSVMMGRATRTFVDGKTVHAL
jgi:dihydroorotase